MLYTLDREAVLAVKWAFPGVRFEKKLCPGDTTRIDYDAVIDGVKVQIYGAPPPGSCRIVEETVEVPAHTEVKRTLICK